MYEVIKDVSLVPHLIVLLVQLVSFRMMIREQCRDRFIIGALFLGLIVISFISRSIAVEMTVLTALSISLIVRGFENQRKLYSVTGLALLAAMLGLFVYFVYILPDL